MGPLPGRIYLWAFLIILSSKAIQGWPCTHQASQVFSRSGLDVLLQFDIGNLLLSSGIRTFSIKFHDGTSKGSIVYVQGTSYPNPGQGVNISGDSSGKVDVTLKNVQITDAGTYLISATGNSRCSILYILGVPMKPVVTVNKNPEVGESAILTCRSTSTTTPSNHSLSLAYNWYVDYSYSTNRKTLTVPDVTRNDASKRFTCSAKEDVKDGFTSSNSSSYSLNVLYGPNNIDFSPISTVYEKVENTTLFPVRCNANCNPTCSFKWNKADTMAVISENAVLDLGTLTSSKAGTYRCTATRAGGSNRTKDLTVNVIYGPTNMYFIPATASYRHDENFNLPPITCSSKCWDCQYSWKGPNMYNSLGPILDLDNLQRSMAGNYSCTAVNIKSSPQRKTITDMTIEVRYGPDSVSITPENENYTVDEGSTLNDIECLADCFPSCKYKWTKENQAGIVSNTEILPLGEIPKSYAGKYTCTARNREIQSRVSQKHVIINVRYGPYNSSTIISPPAEGYIQNKDTFLPNITCSAVCNPNCTYTWTKKKEEKISTVSTSGVLSLGILGPDQAATYTCAAKNPGKSESPTTRKQVTVKVRYGPEVVDLSVHSPYSVTEGDSAQDIKCSADCFPGCTYNWRNLTDTRRTIISTSNVLSLKTVNRYMAGHYKCTSSNAATQYTRSSEKTISIVVKYKASIISFFIEGHQGQTHVTVDENDESIQFICEVDSNPASTVKILFHDVVLKERSNTKHISLTHSSVTCLDGGEYTCEGNNQYGQLSRKSINLFVNCFPRPLHQMRQNITSALHVPVILSFTALAYPQPGIKGFAWFKKNEIDWTPVLSNADLHISSSALQSNLTILNVSKADYGRYRLTVRNDLGSYVQYIFLHEDVVAEKGLLETCERFCKMETENTSESVIIGISLGVVIAVLAIYAASISVLYKRKTTSKDQELVARESTQRTYVNVAYKPNVQEGQNNDGTTEAKGDEARQYTDLAGYSRDDSTTYEVLQDL